MKEEVFSVCDGFVVVEHDFIIHLGLSALKIGVDFLFVILQVRQDESRVEEICSLQREREREREREKKGRGE